MSEPRIDYKPPLSGITHEAIAAMSSLNMNPSPITNPTGTYLSETDEWVRHSMEHLSAVCRLAEQARRRSESMLHLLISILELQFDTDVPYTHEDIEQWMIDKLGEINTELRKSANAGCDSCGTNDRKPGSVFCEACDKES